jgi:hypothetical protein
MKARLVTLLGWSFSETGHLEGKLGGALEKSTGYIYKLKSNDPKSL